MKFNSEKQKKIYYFLKNNSNHNKTFSPLRLSHITGLHDVYIKKILKKFLDIGLIKKIDRGKYYCDQTKKKE